VTFILKSTVVIIVIISGNSKGSTEISSRFKVGQFISRYPFRELTFVIILYVPGEPTIYIYTGQFFFNFREPTYTPRINTFLRTRTFGKIVRTFRNNTFDPVPVSFAAEFHTNSEFSRDSQTGKAYNENAHAFERPSAD